MDVCQLSSSIRVQKIITLTLKCERRCPASDPCVPAARWGERCKCTSKKNMHCAFTHRSQALNLGRDAANFSLEVHSECLKLFMGCFATGRWRRRPGLVSDGSPQQQRIISKIAEIAQCCCVQSMSDQEAGRWLAALYIKDREACRRATL